MLNKTNTHQKNKTRKRNNNIKSYISDSNKIYVTDFRIVLLWYCQWEYKKFHWNFIQIWLYMRTQKERMKALI